MPINRRVLLCGVGIATVVSLLPFRANAAKIIEIPHRRQEKDLCVPTSVSMVLAYFGDPRSPRELKVLSRGKTYDPNAPFNDFTMTWWKDMRAGLRRIGYSWRETGYTNNAAGFRQGIADIKRSIDRGLPVLVDVALYGSHTFVVVGYDDRNVYVKDPMSGSRNAPYSFERFERIWNGVSYGYNKRPAMFTRR